MATKKTKKVKTPVTHEVRSFEDFANIINEENCDMLCGNFYGIILQYIRMRKAAPSLKFTGFNWIDDGKIEVLNPTINGKKLIMVVEGDEEENKNFTLDYCDKCIQMTNHIKGVCQKCPNKITKKL